MYNSHFTIIEILTKTPKMNTLVKNVEDSIEKLSLSIAIG
jgi:hypothetical protein